MHLKKFLDCKLNFLVFKNDPTAVRPKQDVTVKLNHGNIEPRLNKK